ncbi:MAG: hypothetical protein M3416_05305 [Acidobacteriota bacterium]|nr:hypothetical protein [Acidobacteriota bacterium]
MTRETTPSPELGDADASGLQRFVSTLRGAQWQRLSARRREESVEHCFRYWRARGFPYYRLPDGEMVREYRRLAAARRERVLLGDEIQLSMSGVRLANHFHPQMWGVPVREAHTPLERFHDDAHLRRLIRKALTIWPDRCAANESNLRRMLKTFSNTAGVSNFRPTAAKAIYEEYSGDGDRVLDFAAGYGGRLLGCLPLDRHYVGLDPCQEQVRGLREMVGKLTALVPVRGRAAIRRACAEDFLPSLAAGSFALVFSSPPYFDRERYSSEPSQSYLRYPTYEEWLGGFLQPVLRGCRRVLRSGGYLVINIADVNGYRLTDDALRLASRYFTLVRTLRLRLGRKPYLRSQTGGAFKYEPVFVFKKRRR